MTSLPSDFSLFAFSKTAKAVSVPVVSSSLILVPLVYRMLSYKKIGLLTADSEKLAEKHFNGVGWSSRDIPVAIKGINEILDKTPEVDKREKDVVRLAKELVRDNPGVGAIVLECTLFSPFAHAVQKAIELPVVDITTAVRLVHAAINPPNWSE